jgi:hypothetical protein
MSPAGARSNSMPSVGSLSPSQEVTPTTLWCSVAAGGAKRPAAGTRMASKRSSGGVPLSIRPSPPAARAAARALACERGSRRRRGGCLGREAKREAVAVARRCSRPARHGDGSGAAQSSACRLPAAAALGTMPGSPRSSTTSARAWRGPPPERRSKRHRSGRRCARSAGRLGRAGGELVVAAPTLEFGFGRQRDERGAAPGCEPDRDGRWPAALRRWSDDGEASPLLSSDALERLVEGQRQDMPPCLDTRLTAVKLSFRSAAVCSSSSGTWPGSTGVVAGASSAS